MTSGTRQSIPRQAVWFTMAAVVIGGGLWWSARTRTHAVRSNTPVPAMPTDIQVRLGKVRLQGISGGKLVWEVEADNFDYAKNRPTLTVSGLKKVVVLNGDKEELSLTASTLEQNTVSGRIILSGDVTVTGPSLKISTPFAAWDPPRDTLQFPGQLTMRFGEYTLACPGATQFDVVNRLLTSTGGVTLATSDSMLRAAAVRVNLAAQSFEMDGPVTVDLSIADIQTWMATHQLPTIPPIPDSIKERYRDYCAKKERALRPMPGRPRPKGARP